MAFWLAVAANPAHANVSLKNGNFFVGYTDVFYPGGFEPKIERIYNSKTPFNGMFGHGWGNEYEVYLRVSADGSVVVHEYGGGAENRFNPAAYSAAELQKSVDQITTFAAKSGFRADNAYKDRLRRDAVFRNDEWEKYLTKPGRPGLAPRQLANNTRLFSNRFSYQFITRVPGGYFRSFDSGRTEKFNEIGKLIRISDKNNNSIDLSYDKDNKLSKIVDNFNRKIFVTINRLGKVEKIQGENGKEATYKYNEIGELTSSKDAEGNTYTYKYSMDKLHNMVEIGYSDKTTLAMSYWGKDKFQNIHTVKDRDGTQTEYTYNFLGADKLTTNVAVNVKGADGKVSSKSVYEYVTKLKADGDEWVAQMSSTVDGEKTEYVYNEFGLPLVIKKGTDETTFAYDAKGHVTRKTTPTEVTEMAYDPKVGKVTKVVKFPKADKHRVSWSEFQYDGAGNLVTAKNSKHQGVKLIYDSHGRIFSMVDQGHRQIQFKYNENSKPVEITDPQLGSIRVEYFNSGEIKKIDSSAGRKIALQVTTAFQNLLDIIRPAGVTLAF